MKMMNHLWDQAKKGFSEEGYGYIGISKLCCMFCQTMLEIINSKREPRNIFHTCGVGGKAYERWIAPAFYQEEFLKSLQRGMVWESTGNIFTQIAKINWENMKKETVAKIESASPPVPSSSKK